MKILCFDTETTGITPRCQPSFSNINEWPHIVQLGFILYDTDNNKIVTNHDFIIDVNEYNIHIPVSASKIHGITNDQCKEHGVSIHVALNCFIYCLHKCDMLVAHNLEFDWNMVNAEILRQLMIDNTKLEKQLIQNPPKFIKYCTMKNTIDLCKINSIKKGSSETFYKYPKQEELHNFLFDEKLNNLHNAFNDVLVCIRCFYKLWYDKDILTHSNQLNTMYKNVL